MAITQGVRQETFNQVEPIPTYVDSLLLAGASAETVTVPAGAGYVIITGNVVASDLHIRRGGTAAAPTGDVADGTSSFVIPVSTPMRFQVDAGTTFSILSTPGGVVTLAWYRKP
jgi:hypothetical protein